MDVPADLQYTAEHEWLRVEGLTARVGVTAVATDALGDVVHLELPAVGASTTRGRACGEVKSTKSVSDVYAPADGEVTEVNQDVLDDPSLVNSDPYGRGWLFALALTEVPELLDAEAYRELAGEGG